MSMVSIPAIPPSVDVQSSAWMKAVFDTLTRLEKYIFDGFASETLYPRWEDLRTDALSTRPGSSAPALTGGWAGNANLYYLEFAKTGVDFVYFAAQLPHAWKEGTTIFPHVHYGPTTTKTGTVKFDLEYTLANYGDKFGTSNTYSMTDVIASADQWGHRIAKNTSGISMTGKRASSLLMCRLTRNNSVSGNLDDPCGFLYHDIHLQLDAVGSRQEYTK